MNFKCRLLDFLDRFSRGAILFFYKAPRRNRQTNPEVVQKPFFWFSLEYSRRYRFLVSKFIFRFRLENEFFRFWNRFSLLNDFSFWNFRIFRVENSKTIRSRDNDGQFLQFGWNFSISDSLKIIFDFLLWSRKMKLSAFIWYGFETRWKIRSKPVFAFFFLFFISCWNIYGFGIFIL